MSNQIAYSSVSSFYYIEFLVDDSENRYLMSNFRKVRIENDIKYSYPVIFLEFYADNQVFIDENIYPHRTIRMNIYYCNENNERLESPMSFDLLILEMNLDLPPKAINNVSDRRDSQRRLSIFTCVPIQAFELMNMTVNKLWTNPVSVRTIITDLCDRINVSYDHIESENLNPTLVHQCLIPPMSFRAAIDYIDATYGIYKGCLFRYVNYNGTLEMWDLKSKFDKMKTSGIFKVHKMPVFSNSSDTFSKPAKLAQEEPDHYITYDSMETISRPNDAFVIDGYRQVIVNHPHEDIVDYYNINISDISKKYGLNSDTFDLKCNSGVMNKRLTVNYDSIGNMPEYVTDPNSGYELFGAATYTDNTIKLNMIRFHIYRKMKLHLLMRIGMPMYLQPYAEHELYSGSNYSGAYLVTRTVCTITREGPDGTIGDQMHGSATIEAARTSQSQDKAK